MPSKVKPGATGFAAKNTASLGHASVARLNTAGRSTWFDPSQINEAGGSGQDSAFVRLWQGFKTARVVIAVVLVLLQIMQYRLAAASHGSPLVLCCAYLAAALAVRLTTLPVPEGPVFDRQWALTIGVDVLIFALLQWMQPQSINYAPLLALPVLLASVMGSLTFALGTASVVTLYLLGLAWRVTNEVTLDSAPGFFQAGLTGIGYFVVAVLANQLANRLLREEQLSRRNQRTIQLQNQVNELVIETLSDGVMVIDARGVVRAANPAARRLTAPAQRVLITPYALTDEPGWQPLLAVAVASFARRTAQAADVSLQHRGEAARRIHVRTRLTASDDKLYDSLCVVFLEDLPELEARLRQEKMVAMGRMSAAVAHEIRNPLAAITQANALLAEDLTDTTQQRLTTMIGQNAQRLARIVDDVLNIARVPSHSTAQAPSLLLDETVQRFTLDWCQQNNSTHKIRVDLAASGFAVAFDAEHLRQVLVNLLDNAARYAGDLANSIVVSTEAIVTSTQPGPAQAHTSTVEVKGTLRVWSDGQALAPTVQQHLFEPFFSSESRSSGLGLYISRELCERHGAVLSYVREPSRNEHHLREGNTFFIAFTLHPIQLLTA
jgi:two-component system, NtrC family, sensor histidine kinase PilS